MADQEFKPYVPASTSMREMTVKAVLLGVVMAVVLGAANAYLGVIPSFEDSALAQVSGRLAADETMHWTVLAQALGQPLAHLEADRAVVVRDVDLHVTGSYGLLFPAVSLTAFRIASSARCFVASPRCSAASAANVSWSSSEPSSRPEP